ncbi:cyclin-dependent kinase 2-interacting protein-like isoform X3 [Mytilus trossulus]|uniref:cyclin-dependent kinase 2-interacting protein-like isoform X3 n=1 Tax=Mytilus trossulus TaxID=6551 RepID=UPI003004C706
MTNENESRFSPVKKHGQRNVKEHNKSGNLTGSERQIKDGVADVYNLIQKWKNANSDGMHIIDTIANIKLQHVYKENKDETLPNGSIPEELEAQCTSLLSIIQKMEKIVKKLSGTSAMFVGVMKLQQHLTDDLVLFQTWTPDIFVSTVRELTEMYRKEYKLKQLIYKNICHAKDRNTMMFYTSSWLHQPYITDKSHVLLESLLLETGHK